MKSFTKEIKATSIADISLIPTIEGDKKTMQYVLDKESLFKLFVNEDSPLFIGEDFVKREYEKIKNISPCLGGTTGLCVNPMGEVFICVSMPRSLGNINMNSIKDIWQGAKPICIYSQKPNNYMLVKSLFNFELLSCSFSHFS